MKLRPISIAPEPEVSACVQQKRLTAERQGFGQAFCSRRRASSRTTLARDSACSPRNAPLFESRTRYVYRSSSHSRCCARFCGLLGFSTQGPKSHKGFLARPRPVCRASRVTVLFCKTDKTDTIKASDIITEEYIGCGWQSTVAVRFRFCRARYQRSHSLLAFS